MKISVALLVIAAMTATVAYPSPAKNQVVSTTTVEPTTLAQMELSIIVVPEIPCAIGQRRDSKGKCRDIL